MKITKDALKQIIREELQGVLTENLAGIGFGSYIVPAAKAGYKRWRRGNPVPTDEAQKEKDMELAKTIAKELIDNLANTDLPNEDIVRRINTAVPKVVAARLCSKTGGEDCRRFLEGKV